MAYSTADIRNIALVGQAGAGKTLLVETLLAEAGSIRARGSLERGTTVCDFDPQEKQLQHSLDSAIVHVETDGRRINLIDTPGYPDFAGRALSALEAVETAAVVVNAVNGVEPITQRMMEFARDRGLCTLIVINKIDSRDARPERVLADVRETFGRECLPLNLPAEGGRSVVDCFFKPGEAEPDFGSVAAAHTEIIDQVVEVDEKVMSLYLEQGEELTPGQLHDPFEQALREGHLTPVCFVSAETGAGVKELLETLVRLMPSPLEGNPPPFLKGSGEHVERVKVEPDPDRHVVAHVFKVSIDPFVGRLGVFRVHQGTVRTGAQLFVGDARKPFKVAHLYELQGKEHVEVPRAIPGDICAVAKVEELHFDAVLHDSHDEDRYHLKSIAFPPAMAGLAIEPERRGEEQKLSDALHKLMAEDPCVRIEHHATLNETVLYGMGDLHLRVLLERMNERYGVRCKSRAPSIPYRETITRPAEGHHRHKKQTGGAGQFGEVYLRIEPLDRGQGFEFVDEVVGGAIPSQYIPAVEKGVRQVLGEGAVAGFPLQDVRLIVYDGKHHPVDSKEVAFIAAGRKAFLNAILDAGPIVLEPVVRMEVTSPSGATGDITGDLATRRGRVSGSQSLAGQRTRITALVPLAELSDYQSRLKSLTGGEGAYTMELSHYDSVPPKKQHDLMNAFKRVEEE
ncbi:MAG TPA: elongation factor G [Steroidobacter sp.]|jgi:elongation factor G|nr:elongation factor G [Steroidobacter sp.]